MCNENLMSTPNLNLGPFSCAQCRMEINKDIESYLEFDEFFYHKQCYECSVCRVKFSLGDSMCHLTGSETSSLPIPNTNGVLFCRHHFIKLLKCSICNEEFDQSSWICEFKGMSGKSDRENCLAHVECINCDSCNRRISCQDKYRIRDVEGKLSLTCKSCVNQRNNMNSLRLSSKQKELLATYVLKNKISIEKNLDDRNEIIVYLARQINCTPKCIINYVRKRLEKKNNWTKDQQIVNSSFKCRELDELRKRDVFYFKNPPNVYPFGRKSAKEIKSSSNSNPLNVLSDLTNSLIN